MPNEIENATPAEAQPNPATTPITSLKELNALIRKRMKVEFDFNGTKCALEMRRLTAAESSKISEILESVTPPLIKGKTMDDDRLDLTNASYIKAKNLAAIQARAQAVYWSYPEVSAGNPNLKDPVEIADYVQSQLTDPIVQILYNATQDNGIGGVAELVNFT
jgi:hypothetical protein